MFYTPKTLGQKITNATILYTLMQLVLMRSTLNRYWMGLLLVYKKYRLN